MPDDQEDEDVDEELGETTEKLGGIAGRFGSGGDTTGTTETTEANETRGTSEATETNERQELTASASGETTGTTDTIEATGTSETMGTPGPGDEDFQLREHWNGRTIYLPDEDVEAVDLLHDELNLEARRERGEQIPKNETFYPAVFRVALEHPELVREELGLDGDS